jgi:hypothetical protein
MKVYDVHDEQGRIQSFEIENSPISRGAVIKILKTIPGLIVKRSPAWFRFGEEDFCEFELGGTIFQASEPWGDSSRFWLGPSSGSYSEKILVVKDAFVRHSAPSWVFPLRVLSWVLLAGGGLAFAASHFLEPTLAGPGIAVFMLGGFVLIGALVVARNFPVTRDSNPG